MSQPVGQDKKIPFLGFCHPNSLPRVLSSQELAWGPVIPRACLGFCHPKSLQPRVGTAGALLQVNMAWKCFRVVVCSLSGVHVEYAP